MSIHDHDKDIKHRVTTRDGYPVQNKIGACALDTLRSLDTSLILSCLGSVDRYLASDRALKANNGPCLGEVFVHQVEILAALAREITQHVKPGDVR